ncbi:MAG TPA: PA0069 family radical SAM protein [Candidatus Polarisedimenticolaceae bacterium]|nr:PA0069 family radical SAM protein [Candidatus Polarisedimenticolaceae bacterium]
MNRPARPASPGRGAGRNVPHRFDPREVVPVDGDDPLPDEDAPRLETCVVPERTRSVITRNDSPDLAFRQSVNPYRGCEHGCVYCFARPTHAYLGLSPGLDFETKIFSKPDAPRLLREELAKPGYRAEPLVLGANTDPYQPVERGLRITRGVLEVLAEHAHPVSIVTKSRLVLRDLDLLAPMARIRCSMVYVSITTLDAELARSMEPRAAAPPRRLETLRGLAKAGVPCGVLVSPVIPGLTDSEMERILAAAAEAGVVTASYSLLRLPHEVKTIFTEWLASEQAPRAARVLGLLRGMRGGKLYDSRFGVRQRGEGAVAELLERRFEIACRRLRIDRRRQVLDASAFRVPATRGRQPSLFD